MDFINKQELSLKHEWLLSPIENAITEIEKLPFYEYVQRIETVEELFPITSQLFHHSATFPKAMGLMLSMIPIEKGYMFEMIAEHAYEESTHHLLLFEWMKNNGYVKDINELFKAGANQETNNCINIGYQLAIERDLELWIVMVNMGIERAALSMFKVLNQKVDELNIGHEYFKIHTTVEVEHTYNGLDFLEVQDQTSRKGKFLIRRVLECLSIWTTMIHSWIDIPISPKFDLTGKTCC